MVVQHNNRTLTAEQLAAIEAGNFNAVKESTKKAIQKLLKADPRVIAPGVPAAIDNGEELDILTIPLGWKQTVPAGLRHLVCKLGVEGERQPVYRFVAAKAEATAYYEYQNEMRRIVRKQQDMEYPTADSVLNQLREEQEISKEDPTCDEAKKNVDWSRFFQGLSKELQDTWTLLDEGYKEWEIALELGITQGAVSKNVLEVERRWKEFWS